MVTNVGTTFLNSREEGRKREISITIRRKEGGRERKQRKEGRKKRTKTQFPPPSVKRCLQRLERNQEKRHFILFYSLPSFLFLSFFLLSAATVESQSVHFLQVFSFFRRDFISSHSGAECSADPQIDAEYKDNLRRKKDSLLKYEQKEESGQFKKQCSTVLCTGNFSEIRFFQHIFAPFMHVNACRRCFSFFFPSAFNFHENGNLMPFCKKKKKLLSFLPLPFFFS